MNWLEWRKRRALFGSDAPVSTGFDPLRSSLSFDQPVLMDTPLNPPDANTNPPRRVAPRMEEYLDYLNTEPRKENYNPGKLGGALAAVAGFAEGYRTGSPGAAFNTTKGIGEAGYNEALEAHGRKGGRLKELAELEYKTMSDADKLTLDLADLDLKQRKLKMDELDSQANRARTNADINRINRQTATLGFRYERDATTGNLFRIDEATGDKTSLGKFDESKAETREKEQTNWFTRSREEFRQRRELQDDQQAAALNIEQIRATNDAQLAKLRSTLTRGDDEFKQKLQSMDPESQRSALATAVFQVETENPGLKEKDPGAFMNLVRQGMRQIRSRAGLHDLNAEGAIADPETAELRSAAIQWLAENDLDETDEDNIKQAMEDIAKEAEGLESVALPENDSTLFGLPFKPPVETPTVTMPPVAGRGSMWTPPSLPRNFGRPTEEFLTPEQRRRMLIWRGQ